MGAAGLLLTGGASRRLGQDKAALVPAGSSEALAPRTARLLVQVARPALEVGPGSSGLPALQEDHPGSGPLVAVAAGSRRLRALGWTGPVIVVATDLPRLTPGLLGWLAEYPSARSVIPVVDEIPQTLCARYAAADLDLAVELAARGLRALHHLVSRIDAVLAGPSLWQAAAGGVDALFDIDTPADLARLQEGRLHEGPLQDGLS
jgi:molybdopterin-guanine dinucleotide biosynthesis protein A